jgi:hypothetical protein
VTKSRSTLIVLSIVYGAGAQARQPLTAEEALANYRATFLPIMNPDCPAIETNEIRICGRRRPGSSARLPLRSEIDAAGRPEPIAGVDALDFDEGCTPVGRDKPCGGMIPIIPIVGLIIEAARELVEPK